MAKFINSRDEMARGLVELVAGLGSNASQDLVCCGNLAYDERRDRPKEHEMKFSIGSVVALYLATQGAGCGNANQENCAEITPPSVHPKFAVIGPARCTGRGLVSRGFDVTLDQFASIEYLGEIQAGAIKYSILYYDRNENHGTHAVVILENGCNYFGSYYVDDKPVGIVGQEIVFKKTENYGNVIRFDGISPPARVIIDGSDTKFWS